MALLSIGPLVFELLPLNAIGVSRNVASDFARKAVIGAKKPLEAVGVGDETFNITARLFPERFGGKSSLTLLETIVRSQVPQLYVRGDGAVVGWCVVTGYSEKHSSLASDGVGRVVDLDIKVEIVPQPSIASVISNLFRLLS